MNASYEWLRAFVPTDRSPGEIARILTERCATVEEIVALREDLAPIVIARVVDVAPHPDSDHLSLTKVDAGTGALLDVVCGAPNVAAGKLYPFASVGTRLPGGLTIEKRKIRGALSQGMLCSARELGLGEDHAGIMELDVDAAPGTPFLRAVPVGDTRLVIDVAPIRPDLLSHLGLARELGAALGATPEMPALPDVPPLDLSAAARAAREAATGGVTVTLEDAEGAPRYMGLVIRGVTIGPSPRWLADRVSAIGMRSISNVVDATNYVMHELGQPIHAFDLARLRGGRVIVRESRPGERVTTLDGTVRALPARTCVIADAEGAQAIAGIMGGAESEIGARTTDLFIEVACFDPARTRAARRGLGLTTEASYRFERGVDPAITPVALQRVARLILGLAGGMPEPHPVDLHPAPRPARRLTLRASRAAQVLGEMLAPGAIAALLEPIGFECTPRDAAVDVVVPSWRPDVIEEIDLVEEVARLHGYDRFSEELRPFRAGTVPDAPIVARSRRVRERLVALGLLEARPVPFVAGDDATHVRIANPIAENEPHLRRAVLESLARRAEYNLSQMQRSVRLFEIGPAFEPAAGALPREDVCAAAVVLGDRRPAHFTEPRPPAFDVWDAKYLAEEAARAAYPGEDLQLRPASDPVLWTIHVGGREAGVVRRLELDAPVWAAPACGFELVLEHVDASPAAPPGRHAHGTAPAVPAGHVAPFRPIPSMPAAEFDLALLVPETTPAARVEEVLVRAAGDLLERASLFDEFRGGDVPSGARSLAWRLTFRHPERTLGAKEVDGRREKILRVLESELGVRQRAP